MLHFSVGLCSRKQNNMLLNTLFMSIGGATNATASGSFDPTKAVWQPDKLIHERSLTCGLGRSQACVREFAVKQVGRDL